MKVSEKQRFLQLEPIMFLGALGSYNTFNEFTPIAMVTAPRGKSEPK